MSRTPPQTFLCIRILADITYTRG